MSSAPRFAQCLRNPLFARLYSAQTINLLGDALTWLGLSLLAFELVGEQAGQILSTALTLRVITFVVLSPFAGSITDRVDRKLIMTVTHLARMLIVCLFPFVTQPWQIYGLILLLNGFSAFFTPTYKATIPLVASKAEYPQAIALSSATYQLLGVLGPGLAGSIAAFVGTRQVFFLDGITFLVAAVLVVTLPGHLTVASPQKQESSIHRTVQDIRTGTMGLFLDPLVRYALLMQLVAAIAGAAILVNTVTYVQGSLQLGKFEYGLAMAAFGIGATLASIGIGAITSTVNKILLISGGAILITITLFPANWSDLGGLLLLWAVAGFGQTLVNVPTQTLIADRFAVNVQGRLYGAHFAWSHLWWALSYPLAGWLGGQFPKGAFLGSSLVGISLWLGVYFLGRPASQDGINPGQWHEHEHRHDSLHGHAHSSTSAVVASHRHLHFHGSQSLSHH